MQYIYEASSLAWSSGGTGDILLSFLPRKGPRGGRVVVERFIVRASLNYTTGAGVSMSAPDFASAMKRLLIRDAAGNRVYCTGPEIRTIAAYELGDRVAADPTALAQNTTATKIFVFDIPFSTQRQHAEYDTALPADDVLDGGGIRIEMPAGSDLNAAGGTPTINSGTYKLYAVCREEWDVIFHARNEWKDIAFTATDLQVPVNGSLLRTLIGFKNLALTSYTYGGDTNWASLATIVMESFGITNLDPQILKRAYLDEFPNISASDPFFNDAALAMVYARDKASILDYPRIGGQLLIKGVTTPTNVSTIVNLITPRSQAMMASAAAVNGVSLDAPVSVDAKQGSKSDLGDWGALADFIPVKARKAA